MTNDKVNETVMYVSEMKWGYDGWWMNHVLLILSSFSKLCKIILNIQNNACIVGSKSQIHYSEIISQQQSYKYKILFEQKI